MHTTEEILEKVHSISHVLITEMDTEGILRHTWPQAPGNSVEAFAPQTIIHAFYALHRDCDHPIIHFVEPGFFLAVMQMDPDTFVMIGLVSPFSQTREDILKLAGGVIHPIYLSNFCDLMLQQPSINLEQMQTLIQLIYQLSTGEELSSGNILFLDQVASGQFAPSPLELREDPGLHVSTDFEAALCDAIEMGNRAMLERRLFAPHSGHVGRMSMSDLRQEKYSFICLATLATRAAIRGGLPSETAFSLSDLYCQRVDLLTDISSIQNLVFTMLTDFCRRVQEGKKLPLVTPVILHALDYISVHLHEQINMDDLSKHCGLCTRSLSLRFRKEVGMGVPEYIHLEKLKEAKYLLRHTDYSLAEITTYLNYPSQSYFTQIFKKYTKLTPQQYRMSAK